MYVTTASNPQESSYACYYDSKLETYLGDCYSVNWMEDVDKVGDGGRVHSTLALRKQKEGKRNPPYHAPDNKHTYMYIHCTMYIYIHIKFY